MTEKTRKVRPLQLHQALYAVVARTVWLFPKVDVEVEVWQDWQYFALIFLCLRRQSRRPRYSSIDLSGQTQ